MRQVDLEILPLYVKAGTILPLGPVKQYAQEASSDPLTLRIYPGADGAMALYQDDGISFGYLKGQFSRLLCTWNDNQRILTLKADANGKLPMRQAIVVEMAGRTRKQTAHPARRHRLHSLVIGKAPLETASGFVSGHDSSRAVKAWKENWASAPARAYPARNTLCGENSEPKEAIQPLVSRLEQLKRQQQVTQAQYLLEDANTSRSSP